MGLDLWAILLFIIPPYVANAAPVVLGGGPAVDFGANAWDGKRVLGDGKTWRGLLAGVCTGVLAGAALSYWLSAPWMLVMGISASGGAMLGDLAGSFIKRRMGMERGKPSFVMDQLLFIVFAMAFSAPVLMQELPAVLYPESVLIILLLTYVMHRAANIAANRLGLKGVPW
ncbi:MAG: CDP-2,3-bis-(O-geranylgeranyl)-sn-glycerol synthase [Candidatus Micrarchaeota archaeon]|nr:CDP-2,3-bis-(O-geranylgeranyl)-sn-glycerol synthase [Candidatus Micrarchaeota archaeon]